MKRFNDSFIKPVRMVSAPQRRAASAHPSSAGGPARSTAAKASHVGALRRRLVTPFVLLVVMASVPAVARAEPLAALNFQLPKSYWQRRPPSAFRLKLALDLGLLLTSVPLWAILLDNQFAPPTCGSAATPCDRSKIDSLDRQFIYANRTAFTASDIIFPYAMLVITPILFIDYGPHQWRSYLTDLTILGESVAMAAGITHLVRVTTRRERPYLYVANAYPERRNSPDATMSFWSGHVSYTMAFGVSTCYMQTRRHGLRSAWTWSCWGAALTLGAVTATLQVMDGEHFLTDVLVGAGIGSGIGLLIPTFHPLRQTAAQLTVVPTVTHDHAGLSLVGRF